MLRTRVVSAAVCVLCTWVFGCGSGDDNPKAEPPSSLSAPLCPTASGQAPVQASPDGTRVAYLMCKGATPEVVVRDFESRVEQVLGGAPIDSAIEWLLDGEHVLYGSPAELWVRAADASEPAVNVAEGPILAKRAFMERVDDTAFSPQLLLLESVSGTRRISVRGIESGYSEATLLLDDPNMEADLSQLSGSGRTLLVTPTAEGEPYTQIQWKTAKAAWETGSLSFGPRDWTMAPVGLGDTHNFALNQDQLVRIRLADGTTSEIVPPGTGLLEGTEHLIDREDAPGVKYVYYIQNGDPTRRDRDAKEEPIVLAEANAIAQKMTPDFGTLIYLSDGLLYGIPAEGGESRVLCDVDNGSGQIEVAFSADDAMAYFVGGDVYRISLAAASASKVSTTSVLAGSMAYDGTGTTLLFLTEPNELWRLQASADTPELVREGVEAFWTVPNESKILVSVDGKLELQVLEEP